MADEERVNGMTPVLGEVEIPSNFESILPDYPFKVADFEGPLDLLIHLIKKNQVDIYDIPIVLITNQYLEYLELMGELNLDVAGEFLVMSATLIHIKSRTLVPRLETESADELDEEDPRDALVNLFFISRNTFQPWYRHDHLQQQVKLCMFRNKRLDKQCAAFRIYTRSDPVRYIVVSILRHLSRIGIIASQSMPVRYEIHAIIIRLKLCPFTKRTYQMSQMKFAGRTHP